MRGRAANPVWIEGMMRHGYRGAAEVTRSVEGLFAFAATLPARLDRQFDVLFDATLGNETRRQLPAQGESRPRARPWPRASTRPSAAISGARAGTASLACWGGVMTAAPAIKGWCPTLLVADAIRRWLARSRQAKRREGERRSGARHR